MEDEEEGGEEEEIAEEEEEGSSTTKKKKKKKKDNWTTSKSKSLLRAGILSGEITPQMTPRQVYNLNEEAHKKWGSTKKGYANWSNNLRNLRNAIERDRARTRQDCKSYGHDLQVVKEYRQKHGMDQAPWHKSEGFRLLKKDIRDGKLFEMGVSELFFTRAEYQVIPYEKFRQCTYQVMDSEPKRAIRFERKKTRSKYPELLNRDKLDS